MQHAKGSEQCPDAEGVLRAVERLFPERSVRWSFDSAQALASASVRVRPTSSGHEATIRLSPPLEGERIIVDSDDDCAGMADALAVALVILLEPLETAPTESARAAPEPQTPVVSAPTQTNQQQLSAKAVQPEPLPSGPPAGASLPSTRLVQVAARVVALGGLGLLSTPSAGTALGVSVSHRSGFGFEVEGLRLWAASATRAPGQVSFSLWGMLGGPCYRQEVSSSVSLESCVVLGAGSQRAEAEHYVRNGVSHRLWMVLGPKVDLGLRFNSWLGGFVSLGAMGQLRRQAFAVEGVGIVAEAPRAAFLLETGLRVDGFVF